MQYHVARCPNCQRLRVVEDLEAKKSSTCPRCGGKFLTNEWLVQSTWDTPQQARNALLEDAPGATTRLEYAERPRRAQPARIRLENLLATLEGQPKTIEDLQAAFDTEGLSSALQGARSGGAIKCTQHAAGGKPSLFTVQPDWRRKMRKPE